MKAGSSLGPAARRVRGLLTRLDAARVELERITRGAEAHVDALMPRFDALSAAPFESVPLYDLDRAAEEIEEPRVARRLLETPAPRATARTPLSSAESPAHQPRPFLVASGQANREASSPRVLPVSARRERAAIGDASLQAARASSPSAATPTAQTQHSSEGAVERAAAAFSALAQNGVLRAAANLGVLADAVLRRARAAEAPSAEGSRVVKPSPKTGGAESAGSFARGATLRPGGRNGVRAAPVLESSSPQLVRQPFAEQPVSPAPETERAPASTDRAPARVQFYFNPLEERAPPNDADDALAERIGQVLREQARRQGVDLT